tara:strand:+ start:8126 stop:8431 length:306 start_codon:yes stop_codon:yes gene_type:complete
MVVILSSSRHGAGRYAGEETLRAAEYVVILSSSRHGAGLGEAMTAATGLAIKVVILSSSRHGAGLRSLRGSLDDDNCHSRNPLFIEAWGRTRGTRSPSPES